MKSLRFKTKDDVEEVKHVLTDPLLRDKYDKFGTIVTRRDSEENRKGQADQSLLYL